MIEARVASGLRRFITGLVMLFTTTLVYSQQATTEGKDFWFGFMQNFDISAASSLEIFITSNSAATGTIEILASGEVIEFNVTPGVTVRHQVNFSANNPFAAFGSGQIQNRGIHIVSDVNVSVYAFNSRFRSADATVVLPTPSLGKDYIVTSFHEPTISSPPDPDGNESQFMIVATEDNTVIEITPSVTTLDNKPGGIPYRETLQQGEVLQVQANSDLTGSRIISISEDESECKNFAVFAGNRWTKVSTSCGRAADHLVEQMYPTNTWGREFVLVPFEGRNTNGDVIRVVGVEENTEITMTLDDGTVIEHNLLTAGDFFTENLPSAASLVSTKPIQVAQFSKSQCEEANLNNQTSPGDPFMIMISPNEQLLNKVTFNTLFTPVIDDYYATIVVNTAARNQLLIDGSRIPSGNWEELASRPELSYARIEIFGDRDYTIESEDGFIAYIYGFGVIESFGYVAGASLENLDLEIFSEDEIRIITRQTCFNSPIDFEVQFEVPDGEEPRFNTFNWDFGDGTLFEGKATQHFYEEPGVYTITMTASNGEGACATQEVISREIEVLEPLVGSVTGSQSVCPNVEGVEYTVTDATDNTYRWLIDDGVGEIVGSDEGRSIIVNWFDSNPDARLRLVATNNIGCRSDTLNYPVRINEELEPSIPVGPADVCFNDLQEVEYTTASTPGSSYFWVPTGGEVIAGQGTNTVRVRWFGVGEGTLMFTESAETSSNFCDGDSPVLNVTIHSEITISETVTDVKCFNGMDGSINLIVNGGEEPYTITWDGGVPANEGFTLTELSTGTYNVTVEDGLGCIQTKEIFVDQPDELVIISADTQNPLCNGASNGVISIVATGGTEPYSYHWEGPQVDVVTTNATNNLLKAGTNTVTVIDANGCEVSETYVLTEPDPLEPNMETLINLPICPDASDGTVFIDAQGGTRGYQFFWNTNPQQEGMEATGLSKGNYRVTIIDANGCTSGLDVEVTERFPRIFIPNAFSPNGDTQNDEFLVIADCAVDFSLQVLNKWGSIVFATNDPTDGWNGQKDGEPVPDGAYSYVVSYGGAINGIPFQETLRGTIRLFR